ncbi:TetR/AcrR family transcriptional regulator [Streptomyces massasporeus]|uniref:TetR/AcrR family transcriptional regulator n=1 Tax=Streptomyces massasporeus TaxID=67324 RepID=UPI0033E8C9E2
MGQGKQPATRGRPRSEAVERAIVESVLGLLEEGVPLAELSIERIARHASVGKASIYRRWKGKEDSFADVLGAMDEPEQPLPGTSIREDLVITFEAICRRGLAKRRSALLHGLLAQAKSYPKHRDLYYHTVVEAHRRRILAVLARDTDAGECAMTSIPTSWSICSVGPCCPAPSCRTTPRCPTASPRQPVLRPGMGADS